MDECLQFVCQVLFTTVHAEHLIVKGPGVIPVSRCGEALLLLDFSGRLAVQTRYADILIAPNEAFLFPPGRSGIVIRCSSAVEIYILRFRHIQPRRGTPHRRLMFPIT